MMAGSRRFYLSLIALFVVMTVAFYFAFQLITSTQLQNVPSMMTARVPTNTPDVTATLAVQQTISFERTAIARFTENPTLALSSTPFYAEIIFNEIVRRGSAELAYFQTDVANMALTASPTQLPTLNVTGYPTVTPSFFCYPVGANWTLSEPSEEYSTLLGEQIPDVNVFIFSVGIEGLDAACTIPFQPIWSRISVSVRGVDLSDNENVAELITTIVAFLAGNWDNLENVSRINTTLGISFPQPETESTQPYIWIDILVALQAYNDGLRGEALVEALGGFIEGD
jgi:hypothetical protein